MSAPDDPRRTLAAAAAISAEAIVTVLAAHQIRGSDPFSVRDLLPVLNEQHGRLRAAVGEFPGPLAVDAAGRPDPLAQDLVGLMSHLEMVTVLFHGLDEIPDSLRVSAGRSLSATHLIARRVRDRASRGARAASR